MGKEKVIITGTHVAKVGSIMGLVASLLMVILIIFGVTEGQVFVWLTFLFVCICFCSLMFSKGKKTD